jgi:hypothetical protein
MSPSLSTWMKLGVTAVCIGGLIYGLMYERMADIANAVADLMGGGVP